MRISTLLVCLVLLCGRSSIQAQGLAPSTVRQVFSLQKGDSLEYHMWNVGACVPSCNYYFLKVIDSSSYNLAQDKLSIFFMTQLLQYDSTGGGSICGVSCSEYFNWEDICPIALGQWTFEQLDTSIIFFVDPTYDHDTACHSCAAFAYDSIYRDSIVYNDKKQNFLNYGAGFDGSTDVYADSIGIIYKAENVELSSNNREQLIYYHKANGSTWGTPFVSTGIANIADEYHVAVYPNPAEEKFVVHTDLYQGLRFELYDVLSEQVMDLNLSGVETQISRNSLPSGIYFWQVTDGTNVIKTGKVVLE